MSIMKFTFVVKLEYYYEHLKYYRISQRRECVGNEQQSAKNTQEFEHLISLTN